MELIFAIGLILILAALAFWAVNPLERFKQSRDQKRFADLEELRTAIEAHLSAGLPSTFGIPSSTMGVGASFSNDGSGWVPLNLADRFPLLPRDPRNGENFPDVLGSKVLADYQFISDGSYFVLRTHLEAESNRDRYAQDGNDNSWYEVGNAPGLSTYFGL